MNNDTPAKQEVQEYQRMLDEDVEDVVVKISVYEAALLRIVRKHPYATLIVEVKKGQPRYCRPQGSEILKPEDGLAFAAETIEDNEIDNIIDLANVGKAEGSSI